MTDKLIPRAHKCRRCGKPILKSEYVGVIYCSMKCSIGEKDE